MNAFVTVSLGLALLGVSAAAQESAPEFPAEQIKKGADLFARNCATCHGTRMRNPQWAVDLRTFPRDGHARFVDAWPTASATCLRGMMCSIPNRLKRYGPM